jgi:hypothetical protein|nr:MAG: hypothetical protein [Caudoviricetes sp.]
MSVSRVKYQKQFFPVEAYNYDWANGKVVITSTGHILHNNVTVTLASGASYDALTGLVTVINANTFSVPAITNLQFIDNYALNGYVSGQSGEKPAQTLPRGTGCDAVIQSYVTGTGGASYKIDVSLDTEHWISHSTITHSTTSGNTYFITVAPGWAYYRANVTSIGANTNLVIMSSE